MSRPRPIEGDAAAAGGHYDRTIEAESARLERFCPVEYAITLRYLERFVPQGSEVAEVGVGVGLYSGFLARRGCRLHLVDVSEGLLRAAQAHLSSTGMAPNIASAHHGSATDLPLPDRSVEAVLLLGPLYHLRELRERQKAVDEAWRVLKPGGIVAAAGINRITWLRDMFRSPDPYSAKFFAAEFEAAQQRVSVTDEAGENFLERFLATGALDPEHAPPLGVAHLTTIAEFRELMTSRFQESVLTGAESFTSPWQDEWRSKSANDQAAWLDLIDATGKTVEGMAYSDHFLFIGTRGDSR
ncbi:MAG TPA: class I SAM-dependent methyltransferase [Bryobacteraceae bacterium]|nr:class I SAM-dependent methyltransferase [Bryobacteraceae bacterium]